MTNERNASNEKSREETSLSEWVKQPWNTRILFLYSSFYPQEFSGYRWQIKGELFWIQAYVETDTEQLRDANNGFQGLGLGVGGDGIGSKLLSEESCHWRCQWEIEDW